MSTEALPVYQCDQCGACCRQTIIEIGHIDVVREPRLKEAASPCRLLPGDGEWDREYILAAGAAMPCRLLDGNTCSIYPTRPNCCVAFEAGCDLCQEARASEGLPPLEPVRGDEG